MNKTLLSAALIAGFGVAALAPQAAHAADGTISFTGKVTAGTCTINVGTASGTASNTVTLPTVSTSALTAAGQTAGSTLFNVYLTGCTGGSPAVTKVATNFEVGNGVNAAGRIIATGGATNVDLQLTDSTGNVINIGSPSPSTPVTLATGNATLPYYVRYYATGATGAGAVAGSVQYSIVYQ